MTVTWILYEGLYRRVPADVGRCNALVTVAVSGWAAVIYQRSAGQQGKVEAMQRLAGPVWDFGLYRPGFREFGWGVR